LTWEWSESYITLMSNHKPKRPTTTPSHPAPPAASAMAYVLLLHIKPAQSNVTKVSNMISKVIQTGGGVVRRLNNSGVRPLPYPIRGSSIGEKHLFANIVSVEFVCKPTLLEELKLMLRGSQETLRSAVLKADDTLVAPPPRADPTTMQKVPLLTKESVKKAPLGFDRPSSPRTPFRPPNARFGSRPPPSAESFAQTQGVPQNYRGDRPFRPRPFNPMVSQNVGAAPTNAAAQPSAAAAANAPRNVPSKPSPLNPRPTSNTKVDE